MEVEKIELSKDNRESNLIRNEKGEIIGYKQSEYTCKIEFKGINGFWVPWDHEIRDILDLKAKNEDYKYPNGLGRNMFLLKYIYPIFKGYLDSHGFKPDYTDLEFAEQEGKLKWN